MFVVTHSERVDTTFMRQSRLPAHRVLLPFLAFSVVVHSAALVALPDFFQERSYVPPRVLEVMLVQAPRPSEVLDQAPPTSVQPQPRPRERVARVPVTPEAARQTETPVLAVPEARSPAPSFAVPSQPPELRPAAPEPRTEVASVAVIPPSFSAAYLRNPAPGYPPAARRSGVQGTVTLKVLVTRDGIPARVEIERTSGSSHLDNAALDTVKTWRFIPARRGTEPIDEYVIVPIVFRLEGAG